MNESGTRPIVLVCVTDQIKCERLIRAGREMANLFSLDLTVLSVEAGARYDEYASREIEHLFRVSNMYGAQMTMYYHSNPVKSVINYIRRNNIAHTVVGIPPADGESRFINGLLKACPTIPLTMVGEKGELYLAQAFPSKGFSSCFSA